MTAADGTAPKTPPVRLCCTVGLSVIFSFSSLRVNARARARVCVCCAVYVCGRRGDTQHVRLRSH